MSFSTCTASDIPALVDLLNGAFRGDSARKGWTHESDLIQGGVRTDAALVEELMNTTGVTFLKYTDDQGGMAGCVCLQIKPRGLYLGMLTVNPELQGAGIGKHLLAASEEHAKRNLCSCIYMTVISDRQELIDWYLRHGYRDTGEREPFTPEPKFGVPVKPLHFAILEKSIPLMAFSFLDSAIKQFEYYKSLGEKTIAQLPDEQLFWQYNPESNSIGTIVKHLWGNMLSRWTDFLHSDGEKDWRDRDAEFDNDIDTREALMAKWNEGWQCLFNAIKPLGEADLSRVVYIRNMGHTVTEAINRQLAHYAYHVGQIVFIGKMLRDDQWQSLSIPRGDSQKYNSDKFAKPKHREHFTDEFLGK